jgi:hypothetical protein
VCLLLSWYSGRYEARKVFHELGTSTDLRQDFPYEPAPLYGPSIAAVENASFLTNAEKMAIFKANAEHLFDGHFH